MTDDWGDIESIAKPKSQVPKLLFCGCGCLIPVLLLIIVGLWVMNTVNQGEDAELQLQQLEEVLPHDEPPEGFELVFGYQPGILSFLFDVEVYVFMEQASLIEQEAESDLDPDADPDADADSDPDADADAVTQVDPDIEPVETGTETETETETERAHAPVRMWIFMRSEDEDMGEMVDTSSDEISLWTPPGGSDPVATVRVQGRDLPVAMLTGDEAELPWGAPGEGSGDGDAALAIQVSPEGAEKILILLIVGQEVEGVTPELINRFLAPFHVGPEH